MARKKTTKLKAAANNSFSTIAKMEKEFMKTPSKLAAEFKKEAAALKKDQSALKATLAKIIAQHKANAGKATTAKAKKAQKEAAKMKTAIQKDIAAAAKNMANALEKHAKLNALRKHLGEFDKIWAKQAKQTKVKTAAKTKKKTKKVSATSSMETAVESFEPVAHHDVYGEATELAS